MPNGPAGTPPPDETQPSPTAPSRPLNAEETPAPGNIPPSDLTLRKVQDLLKDKAASERLAEETGMSREEMEQFVQKFQKDRKPKAPDRPGEEIEVKPGTSPNATPDPKLPGFDRQRDFSSATLRNRGAVTQDLERNNVESIRLIPPAEIRSGYEAYKSTLSRSRTLNPATAPPAGGAGPGSR